jgi:hypothetical protein
MQGSARVCRKLWLFGFLILVGLTGCAGSRSSTGTPNATPSIKVSPKQASVANGKTQQFNATVTPSSDTAVTWQVNGITGGDATHGKIDTTGLYTAPANSTPSPATVTITAMLTDSPATSDTASATVTDGIPPTAPTNLVANPNSASQVGLTWSASADDVSVTQYQIQRCAGAGCANFVQVATSATTAFTDNGLTASTSYSYRISAMDQANNISGFSNVSTANTPAAGLTKITVDITPHQGGLTVSQLLAGVTAVVTDDAANQGVSWSFSSTGSTAGGSFSSPKSASGAPVTFTAPSGAGVVTITATSISDPTKTASSTIGVTDLPGVYTYHNDNARTGANTKEYALTLDKLSHTILGKLFSCNVDAAIYAQPLWVANVATSAGSRNLVFVATQHDSIYAFDADANPCVTVWSHVGNTTAGLVPNGETWIDYTDVSSCDVIVPDIGITGTPVINPATNTIYLVTRTKNIAGTRFFQRLHALDIATGAEKFGGPVDISASVSGTGAGSIAGKINFDPQYQNQQSALLLTNDATGNHVIIAWGSHCNAGNNHGWLMSYNAGTMAQEAVFNTTANGTGGGITMSGGGPAADASGNIYFATESGDFDATSAPPTNTEYSQSIVEVGPPAAGTFPIVSYFTPMDEATLGAVKEQGSGGVTLLPNVDGNNFALQAGKNGNILLMNQGNLGGFNAGSNNVAQDLAFLDGGIGGPFYATPTYWNDYTYFGAAGYNLVQFSVAGTGPNYLSSWQSTLQTFQYPGIQTAVSANGTSDGILWTLETGDFCTDNSSGCGQVYLHAYDATGVFTEYWNSSPAADSAGNAVQFTVPTIANGKVYVGTRGNNTGGDSGSTSIDGQVNVYGLKP